MRPVKLTMSAFGPYSGVEVIDFAELQERNLFLVTGPTGSGKTTIFDAISYALYGRASGDLRTEDTLRSHFSEAEVLTEVQLTFELKGLVYHVHRIPSQQRPKARGEGFTDQKPDATLTIEDGQPRTVITGVSKVNAKIEEIIGINVEQFKQIMMIPQGEFQKLLTSDSQEREKVLQQLFDTYMYKRVQNELNEQAKTLGSDIKSRKVARDTHVTKIKCGDNLLLQEMITAEDKFIDVIVKTTNELIKSDGKVEEGLVEAIKELDQHMASLLKRQAKALEDNKNLEIKDQLQRTLDEQELLLPSFNRQEEQIVLAEKAGRLTGIEDNIIIREQSLVSKEKEQQTLVSKEKELTLEVELAAKALAEETSEEAEAIRNNLKEELGHFKGYISKVRGLDTLQKDLQLLDKQHKDIQKDIQLKNQQKQTLTQRLIEHQKEEETLKDVGVQVEKAKHKYDKEALKKTQLKKVLAELASLQLNEEQREIKRQAVGQALVVFDEEQQSYKEGRYVFFANQAAYLAKELKLGQPCPVCGSLEHPRPATLSETAISEEDLEKLEQRVASGEMKHRQAKEALAVQEERYDNQQKTYQVLVKDVYGDRWEDLLKQSFEAQKADLHALLLLSDHQLQEIQGDINRLEEANKRHHKLIEDIKASKQVNDTLEEDLKNLEQTHISIVTALTEKKTNLHHIHEEVPEEVRQLSRLTQLIQETEALIQRKESAYKQIRESYNQVNTSLIETSTKLKAMVKSIDEDKGTLTSLKTSFAKQMTGAGFEDEDTYQRAKLSETELVNLKEAQTSYHRNLDRLKERFKEIMTKTIGVKPVDMDQYVVNLKEKQEERNQLIDQQGIVKARIKDNRDTLKNITTINHQIKDKEAKYTVVGKLSRIAQGNNPSMMTFERYVLAAFLEDILKAANTRLRQMTQGRYILSRTSELQRKNKQSGLELEVFDNFTGKSRHVKTLSGGEGFKASLSMALGLSDVVQSYAGGVQLDTMFIDEGFGTLDQESLDSAINCLIDLQKSGRLVGIISHVQELKERVDTRLEIISTNKGSESRFVLG